MQFDRSHVIAAIAAIAVLVTAVSFLGCDRHAVSKSLFIIPRGYHGFFYIVQSQTAPPEKIDDRGERVYIIPPSGLCYTREIGAFSHFQTFEARDEGGLRISVVGMADRTPDIAVSDTYNWNNDIRDYFVGTGRERLPLESFDGGPLAQRGFEERMSAAKSLQGE
jgi:hypothetical protein